MYRRRYRPEPETALITLYQWVQRSSLWEWLRDIVRWRKGRLSCPRGWKF